MNSNLAWHVKDPDEGVAEIVFHSHGLAARRIGANLLDMEFESVECKRASEYDSYAELGYVPPGTLIDDGWWFECIQCGCTVNEDSIHERGVDPVEAGRSAVYCSPDCRDAHAHDKAQAERAREAYRARLLERFPGIEIVSLTGGSRDFPVYAYVTFPGSKGQVRFDSNSPKRAYVEKRDLEAWDRYASSIGRQG